MTRTHMHDDGNASMLQLLQKELAHPFNQNPQKWLSDHEEEWQACFECSGEPVAEVSVLCIDERMALGTRTEPGKRMLRLAGSGILWKPIGKLIDRLVGYVEQAANGRPLDSIALKINSHLSCGAAGLAFPQSDAPDESAQAFQRDTIVALLKERGIRAEHTGNAPMRGGPHNALGAAIDCTGGRLQRLPGLNLFVSASPEAAEAASDALLALGIASGHHGYGTLLKQFTFLVFTDRSNPTYAQKVLEALEIGTRTPKDQGMEIRIMQREAPPIQSGMEKRRASVEG